jgi:hypothetical protein
VWLLLVGGVVLQFKMTRMRVGKEFHAMLRYGWLKAVRPPYESRLWSSLDGPKFHLRNRGQRKMFSLATNTELVLLIPEVPIY